MRLELYKAMKFINEMLWYEKEKYGWDEPKEKAEIDRDYLLKLFNENNFFETNNIQLSNDEFDFLIKYSNAKDQGEYLKEYLTKEYSNMNEKELCEEIIYALNNDMSDIFYNTDGLEIETSLLFDRINSFNDNAKNRLLHMIEYEDVINYINANGSKKDEILKLAYEMNYDYLSYESDTAIRDLKYDEDKTKAIILANIKDDSKKENLSLIKNSFYRNLIVKQMSRTIYKKDELLAQVDEFENIKTEFDKIETEEEKAKFITTLQDYDMRLELLSNIKEKENRKLVINSFECEIDEELKPKVDLVQKMIREYFEDTLQDKFDDPKRERMEIIFNKSDVAFKELENSTNGKADCLLDNIIISIRHKNNINNTIGFLIHEYEHLLSRYQYKTTAFATSNTIEEGTADLFSDLVINHYLEKHGKIELNGKRIRVDEPYETYSGYSFENAWQRTILSGLEKSGKDGEALGEYILGDKYKYLEMTLGKEIAEQKEVDNFGMPNLETNWEEIYQSPKTDFSEIDKDSIYARRNFILPMYQLQNKLTSKGINILDGQHYLARYIGNQYFDERKLFEISREEMEEFFGLYVKQQMPYDSSKSAVVEYDEFWNSKIQELSEKEIHDYSFEILDTIIGMTGKSGNIQIGTDAEKIIDELTQREIELAEEGQSIEKTIMKYKRIIPDYLRIINPENGDSNRYANDYIKNLKFTYIEQIRESLERAQSQEVINALTDEQQEKIYLDSDIEKMLSEYGVKIR